MDRPGNRASEKGPSRLSRRALLGAGVGFAGTALLAACQQAAPPTPTSAPAPKSDAKPTAQPAAPAKAAAPTPTTAQKPAAGTTAPPKAQVSQLKLIIWPYEPNLVRENLDRFEEQNADLKVEFESIAGDYLEKLLVMFRAKTAMDTMYVRDTYFAGWADAGFIKPIDHYDAVGELYNDMFEMDKGMMTYKGKRYGLPYYRDFHYFYYNEQLLQKAGITTPPDTLDDLRDQSLKLKNEGISDYPLALAFDRHSNGWWDYWNLVFGSDGHLLEEDGTPTFPDKDKVPLEILKWLVAAGNEWKIFNVKASMEALPQGTLSPMWAGQASFNFNSRYDLEAVNSPERSKASIPGKINVGNWFMPALKKDDVRHAPGWTRSYGLSFTSKDPDKAWRLMLYMGGKDKSGQYYTAKRWYLLRGLGFSYKSLWEDAEIKAKSKTFIKNPDVDKKAAELAQARDALGAPWWSDWWMAHQAEGQQALLKQKSPEEALRASAEKAKQLKAQWEKR